MKFNDKYVDSNYKLAYRFQSVIEHEYKLYYINFYLVGKEGSHSHDLFEISLQSNLFINKLPLLHSYAMKLNRGFYLDDCVVTPSALTVIKKLTTFLAKHPSSGWSASRAQIQKLMEFIQINKIPRVVFSGNSFVSYKNRKR